MKEALAGLITTFDISRGDGQFPDELKSAVLVDFEDFALDQEAGSSAVYGEPVVLAPIPLEEVDAPYLTPVDLVPAF